MLSLKYITVIFECYISASPVVIVKVKDIDDLTRFEMMAGSKQEDDFIGANIKVFPLLNLAESEPWSWPPSEEVLECVNKFSTAKVSDIQTGFSFEKIPSAVPDSNGNQHVIAAHCLLYALTHDLWKGLAMVS